MKSLDYEAKNVEIRTQLEENVIILQKLRTEKEQVSFRRSNNLEWAFYGMFY